MEQVIGTLVAIAIIIGIVVYVVSAVFGMVIAWQMWDDMSNTWDDINSMWDDTPIEDTTEYLVTCVTEDGNLDVIEVGNAANETVQYMRESGQCDDVTVNVYLGYQEQPAPQATTQNTETTYTVQCLNDASEYPVQSVTTTSAQEMNEVSNAMANNNICESINIIAQ
jgi:hypothetical protein